MYYALHHNILELGYQVLTYGPENVTRRWYTKVKNGGIVLKIKILLILLMLVVGIVGGVAGVIELFEILERKKAFFTIGLILVLFLFPTLKYWMNLEKQN
ncbi:hypothetical protein [Clostridium tepidum]|uniref:hypothetical protein n=1 Tax=Clostridium tepidum TaxID=1962263 RepID=UPI0013564A1B|nr:hypothetical protein [Clostridium tepidum]